MARTSVSAAPELLESTGDNDEHEAAVGPLAGEVAIRLRLSVERGQITAAITPAAAPSPERRRRRGPISKASSLSPTTERDLALSQLQRRREKEGRKELLHQFRSGGLAPSEFIEAAPLRGISQQQIERHLTARRLARVAHGPAGLPSPLVAVMRTSPRRLPPLKAVADAMQDGGGGGGGGGGDATQGEEQEQEQEQEQVSAAAAEVPKDEAELLASHMLSASLSSRASLRRVQRALTKSGGRGDICRWPAAAATVQGDPFARSLFSDAAAQLSARAMWEREAKLAAGKEARLGALLERRRRRAEAAALEAAAAAEFCLSTPARLPAPPLGIAGARRSPRTRAESSYKGDIAPPRPSAPHRKGEKGRSALRERRPSARRADEAARRIQVRARLLLLWRRAQRHAAQRAAVACIQRCYVRARQTRQDKIDLVNTLKQRHAQTMAVVSLQARARGWLVRREMEATFVPLRLKMWQMQQHLDAVMQLVDARLEQERHGLECSAKARLAAAWRAHQEKDSTKLRRFQRDCAASRIAAAWRGARERKRGESTLRRRKRNESQRRRGPTKMRPRAQPIQAARRIANSPTRPSRELVPPSKRTATGPSPRRRVAPAGS